MRMRFGVSETDSRNRTFVVVRGSGSALINDLAITLHELCTKYVVVLEVN
jgi:hypothetical protein